MSKDYLHVLSQHCLPQKFLSRLAGLVANCRISWFKNWLIDDFIRRYNVDMSDALESDPHQYSNFNRFFTRALKPEARSIISDENIIVSPVDGSVSQAGIIQAGNLPQAKGRTYELQQLLGGSVEHAALFHGGHFATLYLAPKDYHRVHMPLTGQLREMIYVPGKLFSVGPITANGVPNLFARNERVVALFDTAAGPMAVILVGAMLVASISTVWAGMITPSHGKQIQAWQYSARTIELAKGAEMGHFELGSTVIVLFAQDRIEWAADLQANQTIRLGQLLGRIRA
jgi:phosphatidylserine decarboxylase